MGVRGYLYKLNSNYRYSLLRTIALLLGTLVDSDFNDTSLIEWFKGEGEGECCRSLNMRNTQNMIL